MEFRSYFLEIEISDLRCAICEDGGGCGVPAMRQGRTLWNGLSRSRGSTYSVQKSFLAAKNRSSDRQGPSCFDLVLYDPLQYTA
jgi:hypothetical protein